MKRRGEVVPAQDFLYRRLVDPPPTPPPPPLPPDNSLTLFEQAEGLIAEASTAAAALEISSAARAVEVWARRAKKGPAVVGKAIRYQVLAERRLGQILKDMRERGERDPGGRGRIEFRNGTQLKDLGIGKKQSARAQLLADLPAADFEEGVKAAESQLAVGAAVKVATERKRREKVEAIRARAKKEKTPGLLRTLEEGFGKYRSLLIDPPWDYRDKNCQGAAARHYPDMTVEQIAALPVRELLHPEGGHVWLWTTMPMNREKAPHRVLEAWGLEWQGEVIWNKGRLLTGRWLRVQTEMLCLAVAGDVPRAVENTPNYLEVPPGPHSEKPEEARKLIEEFSFGPRLELFAREAFEGWDRWGLEA